MKANNTQNLVKYFSLFLGKNVMIRSLDFQSNYNGNEFGAFNGLYPLYDKNGNEFWQYTTKNNSTGQSLLRGVLLLHPLKDIINPLPDGTIPIVEIYRLAQIDKEILNPIIKIENETAICECQYELGNKQIRCGIEIDLDKGDFGIDHYQIENGQIHFHCFSNILNIIDYLRENHFDVDDLIGKGFAVSYAEFFDAKSEYNKTQKEIKNKIPNETKLKDIILTIGDGKQKYVSNSNQIYKSIWIKTFENEHEMDFNRLLVRDTDILFCGHVVELSEDIATKYVEHFIERCKFKNYYPEIFQPDGIKMQGFNYASLSIQSTLGNNKYFIIYRK